MKRIFLSALSSIFFTIALYAQTITYADITKGDVERMNFEILGRSADNYLVYKEVKGNHRISVYDYKMGLREDIPITQLPERDDLLDITFYNSGNHNYLLYQYQEGDVVFLKALGIEANGRILNEPILLDTTMIAYKTDNKIYSIITSNDESKLLAFKINKKDKSLFRFTTKLFDESLQPIGESKFSIPMEYKGDYLTGYTLTNDGNYAFVKYHRQANGNIVDVALIEKTATDDNYREQKLNINDLFLDDIKIMIDEMSGRYILSSFYSTTKRGDIDGLYVYGAEKNTGNVIFENTTVFNDDLKKRAKGRGNSKNAFNNFFINNIIVHGDGSFTIASEALYNTNNWDRWGAWGGAGFWGGGFGWGGPGGWGGWGPGWGWGWGRWGGGFWPYSYYSPFFYRSYWWGAWGPGWGGSGWGGNSQQFNAGNIAIVSFDSEGNKTWDNVIVKSQSENNTDGSISYQVLPSANSTQFLINNSGKISELEIIGINDDGTVQKRQPIKAKDKRIDFMPKYGKQTEEKEIIIPYSYKSNISFARVEL
ncbi:hypothetical protein [Niabella ginsengisoli]|uniref:Uncharacterized protein n=1 Tax=Niabella ginsengisoli TaxID=522298 RepID=A0ABS9SEF0_9BACT|nr:hypothetical protein [Niabella ginsengisoli]MCH5596554.1 hypothetical protein [Niabella ginsengisoli]